MLYRGAKIIILDEPTAVLVPQEVDALFENLRQLKAQGHTLIFISHKLDEVLAIADDITVIRRGTTVASVKPADVTSHKLAELMVGSELPSPSTEESTVTDRVLLSVRDIELHDAVGRTELADIDLDIHAGEVLGIAGVEGNGQTELVETLIGMRRPDQGHRPPGRPGRQPVVDPRPSRGGHRLHPGGPTAARTAAGLTAVGEPHPRSPDPSAVGQGRLAQRRWRA